MLNTGKVYRIVQAGANRVSVGLMLTIAIGLINYGMRLLEEGRCEGILLIVCGVVVIAFSFVLFEAGIIERDRAGGGFHGE